VRIAFILGFFDPVRKAVEATFPSQLKDGSVVWIRQAGPSREVNLGEFKSRFFDRLEVGPTHVLVILAVLRGKEWVEDRVTSVIQAGRFRQPEVTIEPLITERNAQASESVLENLRAFGPSRGDDISMDSLRAILGARRVLCVRESGCPKFEEALKRCGFPDEAWGEFFVEAEFDASTRPEVLAQKIKYFDYVLYAFHGFPHAFGNCVGKEKDGHFKDRLARGVVSQFRVWLLSLM
jgi:hypothetical protein